ncbi:MAG: hypothetical protein ABSD57_12035 [Verrucomicrobiota bacterium]|jgi:hypothetical protein
MKSEVPATRPQAIPIAAKELPVVRKRKIPLAAKVAGTTFLAPN